MSRRRSRTSCRTSTSGSPGSSRCGCRTTTAALSPRERQMIDQLVIACRELENIYWRQSDPEALALYNALETDQDAPRRRTSGTTCSSTAAASISSTATGRSSARCRCRRAARSIPAGLTRAEIEAYVAKNPGAPAGHLQPVHGRLASGVPGGDGRPGRRVVPQQVRRIPAAGCGGAPRARPISRTIRRSRRSCASGRRRS